MYRAALSFLVLVAATQPAWSQPGVGPQSITGRILLDGDIPLAGIPIDVASEQGRFQTLSDDTGQFRFDDLAPGRWVVSLGADAGFTAEAQLVVVADGPREIVLRVHGEVVVNQERYRSRADRLRESAESVQVVETTRLRRESADTGEVLARTSGITVSRAGALGSDARLSLAGLSGDQVRVFVDGVPLELAGFPFGVENVPLNLVERVEVYSGVVPIRFGADALGGAINLVTPEPPARTRGSASYQVGSFGTHRIASDASTRSRSGLFARGFGFFDRAANDYLVDVDVPDAQGRVSEERVPRFNDGYQSGGGGIEVGLFDRRAIERLSLRVFAGAQRKDIQHDPVMVIPYGEVFSSSSALGSSAQVVTSLGASTRLAAVAGYTRGRVRFVDIGDCIYDWFGECIRPRADAGEIESVPRDRVMWSDGSYALASLERRLWTNHAIRISVAPSWISRHGDERRQRDPSARDPLAARRDLMTHVAGVEYEVDLFGDRVENIAFVKDYLQVARSDDFMLSRTEHNVGFGEGVRVRLGPAVWLKASYEYATRVPRPDEVFGDGVLVQENLELAPEVSHNANLGVVVDASETPTGQWRASATSFLRDAEQLVTLVGSSLYFQHQNVLGARILGAEASGAWLSPGKLLAADVAATYQDVRNTSDAGPFASFAGERIPNRPFLTATAGMRVSLRDLSRAKDELTLGVTSRYVHGFTRSWESLGAGGSKPVVPSQLVHAAVMTFAVPLDRDRTLSLSAEIQNLTDARVFDLFGVQRPGRALFLKTVIDI
jgi:vitamin B12 transporter